MPKADEHHPKGQGGSRRRFRLAWVGLTFLTFGGAVPASSPTLESSGPILVAEEEPILPIPSPPDADPLKLALGERLFGDPRLSHDRMRACISCHDTRTNGATTLDRDSTPDESLLPLHTPTVFNASLNFRLNWEGTFRSLEAHAEATLANPALMAISTDEVLQRLRADPDMVREFQTVYRGPPSRTSLLDAIATYERSLVTPGSRFDRWLAGDRQAITTEEKNGYRLFKSLGCISCHQGMNVGGNLYQRHGIFRPWRRRSRRSSACPACAMWRRPRRIFTTAARRRSIPRSG